MRIGILIIIVCGLLVGLAGFNVWLSHRPANQMHAAVVAGQSVTQFLRTGREWSMCHFSATPWEVNIPNFAVYGTPGAYRLSGLSSYAEDKDGKDYPVSVEEMAALIEKRMMDSGKTWKAQVHFFGALPRRVYFVVTFGPDQRVQEVSDIRWGD